MMDKIGNQLWKVLCVFITLAVCLQGFSPVQPAQAISCTVTSNADSGAGSLRALLADSACDTIEFSGDMVIPLASTLWVDRDVTIDGTPHKVVISGENQVRVFIITHASATLDYLTITNGADQPVEIYTRWTYYITVADGAGILNVNSRLTVRSSTISNNRADNPGSNGGGIANYDGTVELLNSTVANNTARVAGGGIFNHSTRVKLHHSTVAWNHTYEGKGNAIAQNNYGSSSYTSQYEFYNSLLMNNDAVEPIYGSVPCDNIDDPLFFVDQTSANGSWGDDSYCPPLAVEFDADLIGPLGDYGGDTETVPLLPGNPIINTGDYTLCYAGDQRVQPRPFMECDPGAFESQGFVLSELTGTPQTTYVNTAFAEPLGLTVIANNPLEPVIGGKVKFTTPSYPGAILRQGYPGWWPSIVTISSATISQPVSADGVAGTYNVVAAARGAPNVAFSLTNIYYEDVAYPCTVTSAADSGAGTLREMLDTFLCYPINFDGDYEIRLSSPLEINRKAIVDGGEHRIVINGDSDLDGIGNTHLFKFYWGANATLQNLTLMNGLGVDGGAIQNGGTLTVKDSTFTANRAEGTLAGSGGAIHNTGYLTVTGSTFSANSAWGRGGAIYSDQGSLTLTNNTFSGNSAYSDYGWGGAVASFSSTTINNNTFVGNQAVIGGAVSSSYFPQDIYNNILVKGSKGANCYFWQTTPVIASSNLADDDSCGTGFTNLSTLSTEMNALGSYGGPTQTFQLLPGSQAIDAGDDSHCPATDQRGVTRPQGAACDIGAYEFEETIVPSDYVISGVLYDDLNGNGSRDAGELGIENAPVILALNIDQTPFNFLTADSSADGSFQFTLTPPDGGLPTGFSVSVYVEPPPGIKITQTPAPFTALTGNLTGMDIGAHQIVLVPTPAGFPVGVQGVPYAQTITVTGGDAPYTFTPSPTRPLPAGLSYAFNEQLGTITLSGTPTETGEFLAHIDFTDANGAIGQVSEYFTIHPPMQFNPLTLPDGSLGTAYNQTITVSGGIPPYTFTTGSEQWLPADLALDTSSGNIVVAGTPAEAGRVTLDVYVADQTGTTVEVQRAFWIKTDPSLALTSSLNPSLDGQPVTFSLGSTATVEHWPAPWGQVTFKADGIAIPGCVDVWLETNPETEEPAPNPVTCVTSSLAVGPHTITAALASGYGPYNSISVTLPGGQTVNATVPVLTGISPMAALAGSSGDVTLTITGSNFTDSSVARWNDVDLATTYVSQIQLTATIPASSLASVQTAQVTVFTPGGGTSSVLAFFVTQAAAGVTVQDVASGTDPSASVTPATATATGDGLLVVAEYDANPGGTPSFSASGTYFDIYAAPGSTFSQVEITACDLNGGDKLYWWDGAKWVKAEPQSYDSTTGCVSLVVTDSSSPSLSQLQGTYFAAGTDWNTAPVADPGGPYLAAINTAIAFDGSLSADAEGDPLTYAWDFGDGSTGTGALPAHAYAAAGVYTACLTVNDGALDSAPACTLAVVYDPSAGFVTGGGWIDSRPGAYLPDPTLSGKATFGFVSRYLKGASVPTGNTEFQFQAGSFTFRSTAYDWLVVSKDKVTAQFKGSGMVNGALAPNGKAYKFMLWASDGTPDTFRIRIWWEGADEAEHNVYDNGFNQAIGGGSIVVHTGK